MINYHPVLQWKTLHDQGIVNYIIQQSPDSSRFTDIGTVASQALDSAQYSFVNQTLGTGFYYYRLKIEDSTAHITYSNLVGIQQSSTSSVLAGYPNPSNTGMISVTPPGSSVSSQFILSDMNGVVLRTIPVKPNTPLVNLNVSGFIKGVYKLMWTDGLNYSY